MAPLDHRRASVVTAATLAARFLAAVAEDTAAPTGLPTRPS